MKHRISRFVAPALALAFGGGSLYAVPARPVPHTFTQPDGSQVTLTLRGDEYFHYYETEEGQIVKETPDGWYRIVGNDGMTTDLPALDIKDQTASYKQELSGISAPQAWNKLRLNTEASSNRTAYRQARISPLRTRAAKAAYDPEWDNSDGHYLRTFPCTGKQKVLIILVSFADKDWSYCPDPHTEMQNMLQKPGYDGYGCTGSAFDYFNESSRGIFQPSFDVYGPVKLPNKVSYYGGNDYYGQDLHPEEMVIDACRILDSEIDFSEYDRDGDGVVDNIYVFYAGYGEADGGQSYTVWPHSWDIRYAGAGDVQHDGVKIGHYACSNELNGSNTMTGIGTFCHEFSHVLGLPDLYATSYSGAHTPGEYSLMDHGSYNNNGRTPPIYSAYERYALEWQKPLVIKKGEDIRTRALTDGGNTYKMTIDPKKPTEYFLFENRQPVGNDVTLPGKGMLVWRIDFKQEKWDRNTVNDEASDQCIDIIEADGGYSDDDTSGGSTFPGSEGVTEFSANTHPVFANKNGSKSALGICRINSGADGILSFRVGEGMSEDSDYPAMKPYAAPETMGKDFFTVTFKKDTDMAYNKGADDDTLIVSVEEKFYDEKKEAFVNQALEDYTLLRVPSNSTLTVKGLNASSTYKVNVYRETAANMSEPYELTVMTAGETVAESKTHLAVSDVQGNDARLDWTAVEGADHYLLTVATRQYAPESENITADFSGTPKLPAGWESVAAYSSQAGNYGEAAPAIYLKYFDDYLWTDFYADKEIESVEMWARTDSDKGVELGVYSAGPSGSLAHLGNMKGLSTKGGTVRMENLPSDTHALVFLLENPDNKTRIFMDDLKINFRPQHTDTPVGEYDDLAVNDTHKAVNGLNTNTSYVAYVKTHDGEKAGEKSNTIEFKTGSTQSVDNAIAGQDYFFYIDGDGTLRCTDSAEAFDVVALDGTVIARGATGSFMLPGRGVYIVRTAGAQARKIIF